MPTEKQLIDQAIQFLKNNQYDNAIDNLRHVVAYNPDNTQAWWLIGNASRDEAEQYHAIMNVIRIKPNNLKAKEALERLTQASSLQQQVGQKRKSPLPKINASRKPQNNRLIIVIGSLSALALIITMLLVTRLLSGAPQDIQIYLTEQYDPDNNKTESATSVSAPTTLPDKVSSDHAPEKPVVESLASIMPDDMSIYVQMTSPEVINIIRGFSKSSLLQIMSSNSGYEDREYSQADLEAYLNLPTSDPSLVNAWNNESTDFRQYLLMHEWESLANLGLGYILGHSASMQDDIESWLGNEVAFGFDINQQDILAIHKQVAWEPSVLFLARVKDNERLKRFLEEILASSHSFVPAHTVIDDRIKNIDITIYSMAFPSNNVPITVTVLLWDGYIAVGNNEGIQSILASLRGDKNPLALNSDYRHVVGDSQKGDILTAYVSGDLYENLLTDSSTTSDIRTLANGITGQAIIIHQENEYIQAEYRHQIAPQVTSALIKGPQLSDTIDPISYDIITQLPEATSSAFIWQDLPGVWQLVRDNPHFFAVIGSLLNQSYPIAEGELSQVFYGAEQDIASGLGIDLEKELFNWADGQVAFYTINNPENGYRCALPMDLEAQLHIEDRISANLFVSRLNALASDTKSLDQNIFELPGDGVETMFGTIGNNAILGMSSGLPSIQQTIQGQQRSLNDSVVWQNLRSHLPNKTRYPIAYLNLIELQAFFEDSFNTTHSSNFRPQTVRLLLDMFELFEGGLIVADESEDGLFSLRFVLTKRQSGIQPLVHFPEDWLMSDETTNRDIASELKPLGMVCGNHIKNVSGHWMQTRIQNTGNNTNVVDITSGITIEDSEIINSNIIHIADKTLNVLDSNGNLLSSIPFPNTIRKKWFSYDNSRMVVYHSLSDNSTTFELWDVMNSEKLGEFHIAVSNDYGEYEAYVDSPTNSVTVITRAYDNDVKNEFCYVYNWNLATTRVDLKGQYECLYQVKPWINNDDNTSLIVDTKTGEFSPFLYGWVSDVSSNNELAVLSLPNNTYVVYQIQSGETIAQLDPFCDAEIASSSANSPIMMGSISVNSSVVTAGISCNGTDYFLVWDVLTGAIVFSSERPSNAWFTLSQDNKYLLLSESDKYLTHIWEFQ